jgi:hypothetical protein
MLEKVSPLAPISIFLCHFPTAQRGTYFAADRYTFIIASSANATEWLQKRWNLAPTLVVYPAVEVAAPRIEKEKVILSMARFERGRKQLNPFGPFIISM